MAFSKQTKQFARKVANRAESMWRGAKLAAFDFMGLIMMILGFIKECREPKTEDERDSLLKSAYLKCINNGQDGCIECMMPAKQAEKLRKKLAKKKGLKSAKQQDAHIFNAVMASNVEREAAVNAMTVAYNGDETEDDD